MLSSNWTNLVALVCLTATFPLAAQPLQRLAQLPVPSLPSVTPSVTQLVPGDIDRDGDLDLIVAVGTAFGFGNSVNVYMNDGTGRFKDETSTRVPKLTQFADSAALGDVDGDGDLDLAVGMRTVAVGTSDRNRLLLNDGKGKFTDVTTANLPAASKASATLHLELADLDGDKDLDLVVANRFPGNLNLFLNDGKGKFKEARSRLPAIDTFLPTGLITHDLDGDKDLDIVVHGAPFLVLINKGTKFDHETGSRMPGGPSSGPAAVLDADGDRDPDIVTSLIGTQTLWLNDGKGKFTARTGTIPKQPLVWSMHPADMDNDGDIDLVVVDNGRIVVWANDGKGKFEKVSEAPLWNLINNVGAVFDADLDGDVDAAVGSSLGVSGRHSLFANLHRQTYVRVAPKIGKTFDLWFFAKPGYAKTDELVVTWLSPREQKPRLRLPPYGLLGLDPATMVLLKCEFVPRGTALKAIRLLVPNDPKLVGEAVFTQSLWVPSLDQSTWRLGNLSREVIGR